MHKKKNRCIMCGEGYVHVQKSQLCRKCYGKEYYRRHWDNIKQHQTAPHHAREIEFTKNFFNHPNWIFQPARFKLTPTTAYTPDFYDQTTGMFIEVVGTKSAYHANKDKYKQLRQTFPSIPLELRLPNGQLLAQFKNRISWKDVNEDGDEKEIKFIRTK